MDKDGHDDGNNNNNNNNNDSNNNSDITVELKKTRRYKLGFHLPKGPYLPTATVSPQN